MRLVPFALVAAALFFGVACPDEEVLSVTGGVRGQVCNPATGRPTADALVAASYTDEVSGVLVERDTLTDENGFFLLEGLSGGDHTLQVTTPEFSSTIEVEVTPLENVDVTDTACSDIPLEPGTGRIAGKVCNRHVGAFITDAQVRMLLPDGTELSDTTDATGDFALEDVPAGVHTVYVQGTGFQKTYRVEVLEGETAFLEDQSAVCSPPDPRTTGVIVGNICADDGSGTPQPLAGARVFIVGEIDGAVFEDETLPDGGFTIAGIPAPRVVQVRAQKGSFTFSWNDVQVFPVTENPDGTNVTVDIGCQPLVPDDDRRYLVVEGTFDRIGDVLERMGLNNIDYAEGNPIDLGVLWTSDVFGNYDELAQYDAVFVNCGVSESDLVEGLSPAVTANLRQYVQEGGSLYVSDWAYDLIEATWPEKVDFLFADTTNSAAEYGVPDVYTAAIPDPGLAACVGSATVDIDFNFRGSALVSQLGSGVTTYLRADMQYEVNGGVEVLPDTPITVGFGDGALGGQVIFTSFHQESDGQGNTEVLDGPEDLVLRCLVLSL